jgi:mannose/fructose/sorbose-specific phosphotransferase system IIA component
MQENKMINIIVVSHGYMCVEIVNSLNMIIGETPNITSVPLVPGESPDDYRAKLGEVITKQYSDDEGVIVLTDVFAGTPFNSASYYARNYKMAVASGVNLPMLITLALERENNSLVELFELLNDEDVIGIKSAVYNQKGVSHGESSVNAN